MPIGSIVGGIIGQSGAQAGGDMAWGAANQANNQNLAEAARARNALSPWSATGTSALNKLSKLMGMGELTQEGNNQGIYWVDPSRAEGWQQDEMNKFKTSPGYQFRLDEGIKARDRGASARGMTLSGAQNKAIDSYAQGVASDEYNNYFNQLSALSGTGQQAVSSGNSTSAALTGAGSNALYQGGAARGSAYATGANALASGIGRGTQNALFLGAYGFGGGFGGGGGASESNYSGFGRGSGPAGPSGRY